ncbi:MAG: insulinase family protein [Rickettsiales bacterium]|nr:insulinase family protein [Rickettsiales bacterium]
MSEVVTLPNGLRVINEYMDDVESVSINIWVRTGSRNETKKNNGISHFLEHMAFKGTKTRSVQQIAEEFDDLGGRVNAFTSASKTAFYTKVLKEHTENAVEILADIFQNSVFDQSELDKERSVIMQEFAMSRDDPTDMIYTYFMDTAYKNQPFGREIIGTKKNIESFTREDIINYVASQYKSEDIVISFAGKLKTNDAVKLVKKYFDTQIGKNRKVERAIYTGGIFKKNKKLEQTQLMLGYESCNYFDDNFYTANFLAVLLGGGMSSRLFQEIREKRALCYSVFASNSSTADTGYFNIYCATAPDKVEEVTKAIREEMLKICSHISNEEFNRAMAKIKTNLIIGQESNTNRAQKNASNLLGFGKIETIKDIEERLEEVSIKKIQNYMETILKTKETEVLYGKIKD